ncbi:YbaB/EbfC family nucleoid-associated protein [Actinophytocola sp. S1-96]|uniref:YbaB/EbfC family nucleoid-associated protein n=1 Tax=Actinophytocola gossypii TaxID=2812003 RepID=A0ABT2JJN6_9PSEU|nr:YbaB/EbfC family nucleoid-associated protein [Actinophytocola gossypii]
MLTARDDHGVVEVSVDSTGAVVEVALDASVVSRMDPSTLAHAVLRATRAAQEAARRLVGQRRAYHLGTE